MTQETSQLRVLMRAKVKIGEVTLSSTSDKVPFSAVMGGSDENKSFSKYTPSFNGTIVIDNPQLRGKLLPDDEFYIDFIKAPKATV